MRGTSFYTNKALTEPILVLGAERAPTLLLLSFWAWALFGIFPHWPFFVGLFGAAMSLFFLRLAAKKDAHRTAILKSNSRFLIGAKFYCSQGFSNIESRRKVMSVPVSSIGF